MNINDSFGTILHYLTRGQSIVENYAWPTFVLLLTIDLSWFGISAIRGQVNDLGDIVEKILKVGFFVFLFQNLKAIGNILKNSFVMVATAIAPYMTHDGPAQSRWEAYPGELMIHAWHSFVHPMAAVIQEAAENSSQPLANPSATLESAGEVGFMAGSFIAFNGAVAISITVLVLFLIATMVISYMLAAIEFQVTFIISYALMPFQVFKPTEFIAAQVWPNIFGKALNMGMVTLVVSMCLELMQFIFTFSNPDQLGGIGLLFSLLMLVLLMVTMLLVATRLGELITRGGGVLSWHMTWKMVTESTRILRWGNRFGKKVKKRVVRAVKEANERMQKATR
jgi:type IV secretory pathway TrbL component